LASCGGSGEAVELAKVDFGTTGKRQSRRQKDLEKKKYRKQKPLYNSKSIKQRKGKWTTKKERRKEEE
jgi:hypothetical protein